MKRLCTWTLAALVVWAGGSPLVMHAFAQCEPVERQKLLAADGEAEDRFGLPVSVSGDTAIVGAWRDDDRGNDSGSAYIFENFGGAWMQAAKLLAIDGEAEDRFGCSVSISGDVALVGACFDDDRGSASGSAYVFERVGGVWTQTAKLLASDGAAEDCFGHAVSVSGGIALVGAYHDDDRGTDSGSVYVFESIRGVWTQRTKLLASDGAAEDYFGCSVSISGEAAIVGAYGHVGGIGWKNVGRAYVFERIGGMWAQTANLPPPPPLLTRFGSAVSMGGDTAIVGALETWDPYGGDFRAIIFQRVGGVWTDIARLQRVDYYEELILFAPSVSVSDEIAVVGALYDDGTGSAYVFRTVGGVWTQAAKLVASDGAANDCFGYSVSLSGDTAVVGAWGDDDRGSDSGSAYIFDLMCGCAADFSGDGVVDTRDFIAFLNAWAAGDPRADFDENGVVDSRDVLAFLNAWNSGC